MTEPRDDQQDRDQRTVPPVSQPESPVAGPEPADPTAPDDQTVGTGTSIALGCIAGTILLVIIGLIFLIVVMVVS
jgi:hypothetical protein